jgi:hypothetical protein
MSESGDPERAWSVKELKTLVLKELNDLAEEHGVNIDGEESKIQHRTTWILRTSPSIFEESAIDPELLGNDPDSDSVWYNLKRGLGRVLTTEEQTALLGGPAEEDYETAPALSCEQHLIVSIVRESRKFLTADALERLEERAEA